MKFNLEKLKQIPILEITKRLGIAVVRNKAMCFKKHDRKTPSLSFTPSKNLWHCFGCGAGGNNISLVMEHQNCSFKEAASWLTNEFFPLSQSYLSRSIVVKKNLNDIDLPKMKEEIGKEADPEIYEGFINQCSLSAGGKKYLKKRGYFNKIIQSFHVKDIVQPYEIEKFLLKNFDKSRLLKSGLMVIRQGKIHLIWWDHTILFPFYEDGRILYIQGRRLSENPPKYMGLSGIKKPLYNRDVLKNLPCGAPVFICEGITDTLTATQLGYVAVGVLGAASFNKSWVTELNNFRIIIVPDADNAGEMFERKIRECFLEKGHIVESIKLSEGTDLTDFLTKRV